MALVVAGIDEAGYGPTLGPLCVGMSVFRLEGWEPGDAAPDLWAALALGICRKAGDKKGRVAIDDSKKLKGPNDRVTRHPLTELERGVLTFLTLCPAGEGGAGRGLPGSDRALFETVGAACEPHAWYGGECTALPLGSTAEQLLIAANLVGRSLASAGMSVVDLRCRAIGEAGFNRIVDRTGTKSAATGAGVTRHLRTIWNEHALVEETCEGGARVVCDAQGGRTDYREYLERAIPGSRVTTLEQSAARSRYLVEGEAACAIRGPRAGQGEGVPGRRDHHDEAHAEEARDEAAGMEEEPSASGVACALESGARALTVSFMPEADSAHLPVALASMLAKLTRELMMQRFNRYWSSRLPDVKPTAGYALDARRWLMEVGDRATRAERMTLVRRV